jgi:hypothetical protein
MGSGRIFGLYRDGLPCAFSENLLALAGGVSKRVYAARITMASAQRLRRKDWG